MGLLEDGGGDEDEGDDRRSSIFMCNLFFGCVPVRKNEAVVFENRFPDFAIAKIGTPACHNPTGIVV
jgi:hypothetical protein